MRGLMINLKLFSANLILKTNQEQSVILLILETGRPGVRAPCGAAEAGALGPPTFPWPWTPFASRWQTRDETVFSQVSKYIAVPFGRTRWFELAGGSGLGINVNDSIIYYLLWTKF